MSDYTNGYLYASATALDIIDSLISEHIYLQALREEELAESDYLYESREIHEERLALLRKVKRNVKRHLKDCNPR